MYRLILSWYIFSSYLRRFCLNQSCGRASVAPQTMVFTASLFNSPILEQQCCNSLWYQEVAAFILFLKAPPPRSNRPSMSDTLPLRERGKKKKKTYSSKEEVRIYIYIYYFRFFKIARICTEPLLSYWLQTSNVHFFVISTSNFKCENTKYAHYYSSFHAPCIFWAALKHSRHNVHPRCSAIPGTLRNNQHFADVFLVTSGGQTAPRGCFVSI